MIPQLILDSLNLTYPKGRLPALRDFSLQLGEGEILSLVGKSGSGKSTLLRLIAGLNRPCSGSISMSGQVLTDARTFVRPEQRKIGMVSQGADLFPHLSVGRNIAYGLRGWGRQKRQQRVEQLLEHVDLPDFARRMPNELSGGEAQRIALARALAPRPRLLLLDEPFSNLDTELREHLRILTVDLLRMQNTSAIFVTHHGEDALSVGERVAVIEEGLLVQLGSPREIWESPASLSVASLFGTINALPGSHDHDPWELVRPDQLKLCEDPDRGVATGTVSRTEFCGSFQKIFLALEESGTEIQVHTAARTEIVPGARLAVIPREHSPQAKG